ncbi:hypothetical protein AB1Y20_019556 [Prymnesium parvum]|uniref:Uncharacterized protein n=1 Tax=Prymnesium parvum TaxID=97485 RepID=A0AB34JS43_PRYPA
MVEPSASKCGSCLCTMRSHETESASAMCESQHLDGLRLQCVSTDSPIPATFSPSGEKSPALLINCEDVEASATSEGLDSPEEHALLANSWHAVEEVDEAEETGLRSKQRLIRRMAMEMAKTGSHSLPSLLRHFLPLVPPREGMLLCLLVRDVLHGELQLSERDFHEHVRTVLCSNSICILRQFTAFVSELQARRSRRPPCGNKFSDRTLRSNMGQRRCQAWPTPTL